MKLICRRGMYHAPNATPAVPQRYAGSGTSSKAAGVKVCGMARSLILRAAANGSTNRALQSSSLRLGPHVWKNIYASRQREPETDVMYCD